MKKKELLDKFILYVFLYKGNSEYRDAAWRIVHEFGLENGVKIDDFSTDDLDDSEISIQRKTQITNIITSGRAASPSIIVDYLLYYGSKAIKKMKDKINNDREDKNKESVLKQFGFSITRGNFDRIKELSEKTGKKQTAILEDVLNCYFDSEK